VAGRHTGGMHSCVVRAFGLPERACAMKVDLSVIETAAEGPAGTRPLRVSPYPVVAQDVALIVPASVSAADVQQAVTAGVAKVGAAGLLKDVRLCDLYTGEGLQTRFRPEFFPLTETAGEVPMECHVCRGASVRLGGSRAGCASRRAGSMRPTGPSAAWTGTCH
jgi:phenylalanyl-tRNA synthetase beta chain